jgi:hypothetical protein
LGLQKVLDDVRRLVENADRESDGSDTGTSSRLPALNELIPRCRAELELLKVTLENNLARKGRVQALIWPLKEAEVNKTVENLGRFQHLLTSALSVDHMYVTSPVFATIVNFFPEA